MGANTAKKRLNVSNTKIAINTMHLLEILIDLKARQAFSRFKWLYFILFVFIYFLLWAKLSFFAVVVVF